MAEEQTKRSDSSFFTMVVMLCTLASRLLGFLRTAVITAIFGAGGKADVINATFAVPNNLRKLLAEGALSSAFIPILSKTIVEEGEDRRDSKLLVRSLITFQLIILLPLTVLAIVFAGPLVRHVITQFSDPSQIELSIRLFRFFIVYLILISVSSVFMALLNSHDRFFIPAFTPVFFSVAVISSILLFHRQLGVFSMAVGVLFGGLGQILFQIPQARALGYRYRPSFAFKEERFQAILRRWLPVLATSSLFTINQQIAFIFASGLEVGSVSALSYALVFWQLPFGIFSASVTTVLFPRMSREAGAGEREKLSDTLQYGIRFLFILLIPSALFLSLFGKETISMALQRGAFTAENSRMTAFVLQAYCWGLFSVGAFNFLQRFFYSVRDYRFPFITATVTVAIDIMLSLILKETSLRVAGLAVANSISFSIGALMLFIAASHRLGGIELLPLLKTVAKVALSLWPFLPLYLLIQYLVPDLWYSGSSAFGFLILFLLVGVIAISVLWMYRITGIEMFDALMQRFRRRKK